MVNFVFAAAGLLMLGFGIAARVDPNSIIKALSFAGDIPKMSANAGFDLNEIITSSSVFLIVLGAIVGLVGLFGCIGACCSVKWMLSVYLIVLIIILLAEIALIIFAALYPEKFREQSQPLMYRSLNDKFAKDVTFVNETFVLPSEDVNLAFSSMQFELACCGAFGPGDYKNISFTRFASYPSATVPVSCCALKNGPGIPKTKDDFYDLNSCQSSSPSDMSINTMDCYTALENVIKGFGRIAIGIALAIIGVEVILILLTIWLCRSIGNDRSKGV